MITTKTATPAHISNRFDFTVRGLEMYTMHEALAREHMREQLRASRHASLVRELAAVRRWQRVQAKARAAHKRHVVRAEGAARVSAVADYVSA